MLCCVTRYAICRGTYDTLAYISWYALSDDSCDTMRGSICENVSFIVCDTLSVPLSAIFCDT